MFREDMLRAAREGLFSVKVHLGPAYGTVGFFQSPDVQDWIGDELSEEGIKVSFGEPMTLDGYPSLKLDWYRTRRVVRVSKVVRSEKAIEYYSKEAEAALPSSQKKSKQDENLALDNQPAAAAAQVGEVESEDEEDNGGTGEQGGSRRSYHEKASLPGVRFESEAVADAIRERRKDKKQSQDNMPKVRKQKEEDLVTKGLDAVKARAKELEKKK